MRVSEIFYSLQGEGLSIGTPSVFIRLAGCNLRCGGHGGISVLNGNATWHCDSEKLFKEYTEMSNKNIIEWFKEKNVLGGILNNSIRIVWTGGEPLLDNNAMAIREFLEHFYDTYKLIPYCEVETNGTQWPDFLLGNIYNCKSEGYIQQINCSPKLSNSGILKEKRYNLDLLKRLYNKMITNFKFVISNESDIFEVLDNFYRPLNINNHDIWLMPACDNRGDLIQLSEMVWKLCMLYKFNMSTRLQILTFDRKLGV